MSKNMNQFSTGYIAAPILSVLDQHGVLGCFTNGQYNSADSVAEKHDLNPQAISFMLCALQELGLAEQNQAGEFCCSAEVLTSEFAENCVKLYAATPADMLMGEGDEGSGLLLIQLLNDVVVSSVNNTLQGDVVVVLLAEACKDLGYEKLLDIVHAADASAKKNIETIFNTLGWLTKRQPTLTKSAHNLFTSEAFCQLTSLRAFLSTLDHWVCYLDEIEQVKNSANISHGANYSNKTVSGFISQLAENVENNTHREELLATWLSVFTSAHARKLHNLEVKTGHTLPAVDVSRICSAQLNELIKDAITSWNQSRITAESMFVLSAASGWFNQTCVTRSPKRGQSCQFITNQFVKRDYCVRFANHNDLDRLVELESLCWKHTRSSRETILARITAYPEGQFVLEQAGKVIGVIYSQRISSVEALLNSTAGNVHELHDITGTTLQLIAVNVDPGLQNRNLGDQLLEFMLQRCSLVTGVDRVVAVTLTKKYEESNCPSYENYIRLSGVEQDPVLAFHQAHGADIVTVVADYRPEDSANNGNGVLVSYDIHGRISHAKKFKT